MQKGRGFRVVLLSSLLCLLIAACGRANLSQNAGRRAASGDPAPVDKQVFRYPIGPSDFETLDPALVQRATDYFAIYELYTGLVQFKNATTISDQLAASHQVSADGMTYTFTLRPDIKFSDGDPITSHDVAYSINRALLPATKSQVSYYLNLLVDYDKVISGKIPTAIGDSILIKDQRTIALRISKPAAYFLSALTYACSYVVNPRLIGKYGDKWTDHLDEGGSSGPYKAVSYSHTQGLTVVPNTHYYGARPQIQKIEYLVSGDANTTYKAYLSGQFDYALVPANQTANAKSLPGFHSVVDQATGYVAMNYLAKPFDTLKIRQAFALALNKDLLVQAVLRGAAVPTNHIIPKGMPGYDDSLTGPTGLPATAGEQVRAKQLFQEGMQEAGYANPAGLPPITFSYVTGNNDVAGLVAAMIQEWQTVLDVTIKSEAVEHGTFSKALIETTGQSGPYQMWWEAWDSDYPDPQDWLSTFFTKGADYNNFNYAQNNSTDAVNQQAVSDELSRADVNLNNISRMQQYHDAEQKIVNSVAWLPIYQRQNNRIVNPRVQNFPLDYMGPDAWGNIYVSN